MIQAVGLGGTQATSATLRRDLHPGSRAGIKHTATSNDSRRVLLKSVDPVSRDDASHHRFDSPSGSHRQGAVGRRVTDLTEQVDDLLAASDEVAGTNLAVAENHLEALPAGPPVHHPGHAGVRTGGCRQHVRTLTVL